MQIVRMRWIGLVLVGAIACSKTSTEPAHHAGSSGGTKLAANAEVHVPLLNREALDSEHLPPRPIFVVYQNKTFLRLPSELDLIFSPDGRPRIASDEAKESGHWIEQATQPLPSGTPMTPAELAAGIEENSVVILADGTTPVADVVPAMEAAYASPKKCWWLGVKLGAVSTDGCGREDVGDDAVVLSLAIAGGKGSLTISHVGDTTPFASLAELDSKLRELKASAFFAERTDLAITSTDATTIADLVALFARVHAAGFTSAYLAH